MSTLIKTTHRQHDPFAHLPRLSLPQFNQLLTQAAYNSQQHRIQLMVIVPENGQAAHLTVWHDYTIPAVHKEIDSNLVIGLRILATGAVARNKQTAASWGTLANAETVEPVGPRRPLFTLEDIDRMVARYHQGVKETAAIQAECREQIGAALRHMREVDGRIQLRKDWERRQESGRDEQP